MEYNCLDLDIYKQIISESHKSIIPEPKLECLTIEESIELVNRQFNHLQDAHNRQITRKVSINNKIDFNELNQKIKDIK